MNDHNLTPVYKVKSWSIDPALFESLPEIDAKVVDFLAERIRQQMEVALVMGFTASVAACKARLVGGDFGTFGITSDSIMFQCEMLKP